MVYTPRPRQSYICSNVSRFAGMRKTEENAVGVWCEGGSLIKEVTARKGTHDSNCSIISIFLSVRCARGVTFLELFAALTHRGDARRHQVPKRDLSR